MRARLPHARMTLLEKGAIGMSAAGGAGARGRHARRPRGRRLLYRRCSHPHHNCCLLPAPTGAACCRMSARAKSATRRARQQRAAVIAPPSVDVPSVGTNGHGLGPLARARQRLTTEEQLWGPLAVERRRKAEAGLLSPQLLEFKKVKCHKAECDAIHQMLAQRSHGKERDFRQAMALLVEKLSSCKAVVDLVGAVRRRDAELFVLRDASSAIVAAATAQPMDARCLMVSLSSTCTADQAGSLLNKIRLRYAEDTTTIDDFKLDHRRQRSDTTNFRHQWLQLRHLRYARARAVPYAGCL